MRAADHLASNFEAVIAPALSRYESLEGFDALMNPPWASMFFEGYYEHHLAALVSACLARRPDLQAICDEYGNAPRTYSSSLFPDDLQRLDKVLAWTRARAA